MRRIKWPLTAIIYISIFLLLQALLVPKYTRASYEGAMVREYYAEVKDHDILIIGDCEMYANISPITLWKEYGFTSYIRGSAQQLIWHSYYLLEDALRYEKPQVVIYGVMPMQYGKPQSEAYNRMAIDDMPLSVRKIKAAQAIRMEDENLLSYMFPILRYHDRWSELTGDDLRYIFKKPPFTINGFQIRSDVEPIDFIPHARQQANYQFAKICYDYLEKMAQLCGENGIPLVLIKAPIMYPHWYPEWDEQISDYAAQKGLLYINMLEYMDEIGLDFSTDTYNAGLHLNVYGAEKLADYLGGILKAEYSLSDRRLELDTAARWAIKSDNYHRVIARQQEEIEQESKIITFLID